MPVLCDDLIKEGKCRADCCGIVPMKSDLIYNFWDLLQIPIIENIQVTGGFQMSRTQDGKCAFLNRRTLRCVIYDDRPELCREFGVVPQLLLECPWISIEGERRTRTQRRNVYRGYNKARKHGNRDLYKGGIKT